MTKRGRSIPPSYGKELWFRAPLGWYTVFKPKDGDPITFKVERRKRTRKEPYTSYKVLKGSTPIGTPFFFSLNEAMLYIAKELQSLRTAEEEKRNETTEEVQEEDKTLRGGE